MSSFLDEYCRFWWYRSFLNGCVEAKIKYHKLREWTNLDGKDNKCSHSLFSDLVQRETIVNFDSEDREQWSHKEHKSWAIRRKYKHSTLLLQSRFDWSLNYQTSMEGRLAVTGILRWVLCVCYRGNCECLWEFSSPSWKKKTISSRFYKKKTVPKANG